MKYLEAIQNPNSRSKGRGVSLESESCNGEVVELGKEELRNLPSWRLGLGVIRTATIFMTLM
jgi:hypothetical protein